MFDYQVADGFDNEAGYSTLALQPRCEGVRFPRTFDVISAKVYEDGERFALLIWGVMKSSEFDAMLTEFGLTTDTTNEITITLPGDDRTAENWNAVAVRPRPLFRNGLYRNVQMRLKALKAT